MSRDPLNATIEADFASLLGLLRDMRAVGARTIEAYDGKRHSREEHNFIFFAARATECLGAMECLFTNGWENDATSLVRTIADIYIEVLFIGTDRAGLLRRYTDFGVVASLRNKERMAKVLRKTADDLLAMEYAQLKSSIDPKITSAAEYVTAYRTEAADVAVRWAFKGRDWHHLSAFDKAVAIDKHRALPADPNEVVLVYDLIYRMGSEALHAGVRGITRGAAIDGSTLVVNHDRRRPKSAGGILLLIYATHLYLKVLDNVNSELALGIEVDLLRLEGGHRKIWSPDQAAAAPNG